MILKTLKQIVETLCEQYDEDTEVVYGYTIPGDEWIKERTLNPSDVSIVDGKIRIG